MNHFDGEYDPEMTGPIWATETEDLDCTLLKWDLGHEIAEHVNDEVDVVMTVLQGNGQVHVDGEPIGLSPGMIIVIPKGARRSVTVGSEGVSYLNVHKRRRRLHPLAGSPRR